MKIGNNTFFPYSAVLLLLASFLSAPWGMAKSLDDLGAEERAKLDRGEPVYFFEDVEGSSWPKVIYFQLLKATAEEGIAVFHDYSRHKNFLPNMKASTVTTPDYAHKNSVDIDYVVETGKLPFWPYTSLGDENYTTRNTLTLHHSQFGSTYLISWKQIRADSTKSMDGMIQFDDRKEGDSLLHYETSTVPGHWAAGFPLVVKEYQKVAAQAMSTFVARIHKMKISGDPLLAQEIELLRSALGHSI